jgi:predicted transcriptional regulator
MVWLSDEVAMSEFLSDQDQKILHLNTRRKVYTAVKLNAGSHYKDIEQICKMSKGSASYHLNYLLRQGLISQESDGNKIRFFPRNFKKANERLLSLLRQQSIRKILLYILSNQNCSHSDIVDFVKLSPSTVSWHLRKLIDSKTIISTHKGRKTFYTLRIDKKDIIDLLITYQQSFFDKLVDNIVNTWDI